MMLFKLSVKNISKSMKDYTIYFLTLIMGVAIFYMFNSLDSQEAMLEVSSSTKEIVKMMVDMIGMVSVLVALILGFLIVYANNFLIKRRKKEFGLYMSLGMGKWQVSRILLGETLIIGLMSLLVGLLVGVFGSQLMSVLVAKMFQADMSAYQFVFSKAACLKTCMYFGVMYLAVMVFNVFTVSKYKLIDLLTAVKKNEKVKMKNPVVCVIVFLVAVATLVWAYYKVTAGYATISNRNELFVAILAGIISTFLIFWSMSGFILKLVQTRKNVYLNGTNLFVLRQIHNKINTTVVSMTIICLLLFMTISILSASLSLNNMLKKDMEEMTPVDINLYKEANLSEKELSDAAIQDSKLPISVTLEENGLDMDVLKDVVEVTTYATEELTWKESLGVVYEDAKQQVPFIEYQSTEDIIKLSDYNKIARLYGIKEYALNEDEYIVLCDYDNMVKLRNLALQYATTITVAGKEYYTKYDECQSGYIMMSNSHTNAGIIVVPDSCNLTEDMQTMHFLIGNYNIDETRDEKEVEALFNDYPASENSPLYQNLEKKGIQLYNMTKIDLIESGNGMGNLLTFIAMYLGVIFLIASSAILALKELTENSDNQQRYLVLRKIGVDEKMINQTLFRQIGIFFLAPLVLAIIHSVFGIQFALKMMAMRVEASEMLPSVIATAAFLVAVYGGYFLATYAGSKNIIKEG